MSPPGGETAPAYAPLDRDADEDHCDECGRSMPLTGDSLCLTCDEADKRRYTCLACGGPKVFLDEETCSDACDEVIATWPEP